MTDYNTNNQAIHAPLATVSIGTPIYKEFNGNHAYVIYPATFADTQNGKSVVYKGNWTITLLKIEARLGDYGFRGGLDRKQLVAT